ncbi:flagellar basal body-associated protein FliL [Virgibacillus salexigens]|uniref:Flagellar protein FliL n=1 Tax=Virgibacillus massiliensis TaxID=1462526 RepID=A0A024QCY7_9BACI|nr:MULTISPECIES: flagellar basal body-associated protein FliL [Virgibacillus]CDQ40107.1 flagellar basal body-associated protein FliL [Virgibacillus massiliensis]
MTKVSRLVKTMMISVAILAIGGIAAFMIFWNMDPNNHKGSAASIKKIEDYAYETPEITTDLNDDSFVRIQFQVITDSKEAKEELGNRDFQLKNILIKELTTMEEEDFKTGLTNLEEKVKTKINEVMTSGKVTDVYTINKILQ